MDVVLRYEPSDVRDRLAELGLTQAPLRDVARRGYLAYISCTANHPPLIPPILAWGEAVCALREYVLPLGWSRSDENNYSVVIDSGERVAIAVATGDEGTGLSDSFPSNKARKGPNTIGAVNANQLQLGFMEDELRRAPTNLPRPSDPRMTWVLLIHRASDEVRCELSLPSSMALDGHIDGWCERILLRSISIDGDLIGIAPPTQPDINVEVKRRA